MFVYSILYTYSTLASNHIIVIIGMDENAWKVNNILHFIKQTVV